MSRISVATRIQRLLAILQWIAASPDGVEIEAACERFDMARAELLGELQMASMIGDGSTNFDDMPFLVIIEENRVEVSLLSFRQPLRMTRAEQLALLTAAGALVDPAGDPRDPLARALHKLAAQLGVTPGETFEVDLDHDGGPLARALDDAVGARRRVRFTYWTFGRDAVGERSVEPWRVFSRDDEWYLVGLDVDRGGTRHFRLDRIHDLVVTDEVGAAPPRSVAASIELDDELPTVELDLPASASWVVEAYPVRAVHHEGDRLLVTLAVTGPSWLERVLLRVGPEARIVRIDDRLGGPDLATEAAERILARYR
ncbi:MAG TPA: WYL domain-containing protein [Acidimicrobiales bacterium]|jgi:predicted DNA-binding transcriptional regulator YafY|nr:WYL domain-containing protein [Acidimicrobiales bacterium]HMS89686.1 WYL domain-containing protein [Acidimicrobiales bacterium]HRA35800.1 WYL domain-containing protein [Acidimicrobiales bacterium]